MTKIAIFIAKLVKSITLCNAYLCIIEKRFFNEFTIFNFESLTGIISTNTKINHTFFCQIFVINFSNDKTNFFLYIKYVVLALKLVHIKFVIRQLWWRSQNLWTEMFSFYFSLLFHWNCMNLRCKMYSW